MPVEIAEYAKVKDDNGVEAEGKVIGSNLVGVEDENGTICFGQLVGLTKIRTKITCDLGSECTKGKIDGEFHSHPKTIEFDDTGSGPGDFIKEVSQVVIASDYKGEKLVFCCYECSSKHYRKQGKYNNVVEFPSGKGKRTFETGSKVLDE